MIVLDASALIAVLDDVNTHHQSARTILRQPDSFAIHTLNLAETLVHGARHGQVDDMSTAIDGLRVRELDRLPAEAPVLAALRAETGLKLPDCCVIAVAEGHQARVATFDTRLARAARDRGIEVLGAGR